MEILGVSWVTLLGWTLTTLMVFAGGFASGYLYRDEQGVNV